MRYSVALLATFVFVGCSMSSIARGQSLAVGPAQRTVSEGQKSSTTPPVGFLIDSAAADFRRQSRPARFRHVRVGHILAADAAKQYMLCGEFLPVQGEGNAEWTPFITIKTSGYEQYLGNQAADLCRRSAIVWDRPHDLSSALQSRFDALHKQSQ